MTKRKTDFPIDAELVEGALKEAEEKRAAWGPRGRPFALTLTRELLKQVHNLSLVQCTVEDLACMLGVSENTFVKFKAEFPVVQAAMDLGYGAGRASLRMTQFRLARKNAAMAIFLGKNLLGQKDEQRFAGFDGGPIKWENLSGDQLIRLLDRIEKELANLPPEAAEGHTGTETTPPDPPVDSVH
jgi:hypothetical protein